MLRKKGIWLIVAAIVALGVVGGIVGFTVLGQKSAEGHITASEARQQGASLAGREVTIAGRVLPGSISWNSSTSMTQFLLADNNSNIEVLYRGAMPGGFRPGDRLAVEARYLSDGRFEALSIPSNALCSVCHS